MFETLVSKITEAFEPKVNEWVREAQEEAYKKGAEDVIRRFAFVYETVAQTAKADAYAEAGAINIDEIKEQKEWKYVEKDGNPKEMGTYYCLVVAPSKYNGKTIPYYEYDTRWLGEGETAQAWKMDGQPDSGLVWTEQTGSMESEQVYAWRELPDTEPCVIDPQAFERLCKIK